MRNTKFKRLLANQWHILKKSVSAFGNDNPLQLGGTTAYFAIFSMAPILIIIVSVFGYFTGNLTVKQKLFNELNTLIGADSSQVLEKAIDNYQIAEKSAAGTVIGIVFFLISATTLFTIMQNSINYIWRVRVKKGNLKMSVLRLIRDRLLSFGIILSMGFVLLISMLVDASVSYLKDLIATYLSERLLVLVRLGNVLLSLGIIGALFALIYHYLPDVRVKWSASWYGGLITALLFMLGRILIGILIGTSELGAVYGAASSFIVILTWIYYASVIFYFGVELTRQYSSFYGHRNSPVKYAVPFEIKLLNDQGDKSRNFRSPSPNQ